MRGGQLGLNGRDTLSGGGTDTLKAGVGKPEVCDGGAGLDTFKGCERKLGAP